MYLKKQIKVLHRCFVYTCVYFFSSEISKKLLKCLFFFSSYKNKVFGFFLHNPLNFLVSSFSVVSSIAFNKDLDGLSFKNQFTSFLFKPFIFSSTAKSVLRILKGRRSVFKGLYVVVASVSGIIGIPLMRELLCKSACVSVFKEVSSKLCQHLLYADVFITAFPRLSLFGNCFLYKKQLILIDIATVLRGKNVTGNFSSSAIFFNKNIYFTVIPGGVGSFTTSCFLLNTFILFLRNSFY